MVQVDLSKGSRGGHGQGNRGRGRGFGGNSAGGSRGNGHESRDGNLNWRERQRQGSASSLGASGSSAGQPGEQDVDVGGKRRRHVGPTFGFKRLFNFLTADAGDVICNIFKDLEDWKQLLKDPTLASERTLKNGRTEFSDDMLILVVCVLGEKVCSDVTTFTTAQNGIMAASGTSIPFRSKIQEKCNKMMMSDPNHRRTYHASEDFKVDRDPVRYFKNLRSIIKFLEKRMKQTAVDFLSVVFPATVGMYGYWTTMGYSLPDDLAETLEDFKLLKSVKEELEKELEREKRKEVVKKKVGVMELTDEDVEYLHGLEPPDDFRFIPVIPEISELLSSEEPFLRPNKTRGAYENAEHYLDVQFRLLREDFVRPLKNGIQDYRKNKLAYLSRKKKPPIGNVRMYHGTQLKESKEVRGVQVQYVLLPQQQRKIKWERSKRLLNGSLLIFTPDDFKTAFFGIVQERKVEDLNKGLLGITWCADYLPSDYRKPEEFLMVECEVYFEAYRYTLDILKQIDVERFPMSKFIVDVSTDVQPPRYLLETDEVMKIGHQCISPLNNYSWPSADALGMDQKQWEAFKACMTKEFAIVQGPPGTGKTYLGLQVVKSLLENRRLWKGESENGVGPILIVCYTNHALDQFLEGILKLFAELKIKPSMIRVGGMSKTEALTEFSLQRQRVLAATQQRTDPQFRHRKRNATEQVRQCEEKYAQLKNLVQELSNPMGVINFSELDDAIIFQRLSEDVTLEMIEILSSPQFYGYTQPRFNSSTDVQTLLKSWFKIKQSASTNSAIQSNAVQKREHRPSTDDASDDDEEDFDLDELLEKRLLEEINDESEHNSNTCKEIRLPNVPILLEGRRQNLRDHVANLKVVVAELGKQKKTDRNTLSLVEYKKKLEDEKAELESLNAFHAATEEILKLRKQKRLDLLEVPLDFLRTVNRSDLQDYPMGSRWSMYFCVLQRAVEIATNELGNAFRNLAAARANLQDVIKSGDGKLLAESLIVGMTTTGAAKYNDILRMAQAKIVIVEEAAEVLESHIVTCITPACQQLLLIGDHQQLRPSTTVYELAKKCNLDISLFERMVNNDLNCYKIDMQHRMRPEIADLVVGTIYPVLRNAPTVYDYPSVPGVASSLFFITHEKSESSDTDSRSKSNEHEAQYLASLCRYLMQQGYAPEEVTVLTTYTGQMFLLKQKIREYPACKGVRVTCVDNFQGEENLVILLSLVRSNDEGNIGFLKTDNRICVALSRAKHGLYIIGNMSQLVKKSKTWEAISGKLQRRDELGDSLQIQCQIHKTVKDVRDPADFNNFAPEGGCLELCKTSLKCGHVCRLVCHIPDRNHEKYRCQEACRLSCCRGHPCKEKCFVACPDCMVVIPKLLPCDHTCQVRCSKFDAPVRCMVVVNKELPCKHSTDVACWVDEKTITCTVRVRKQLPCFHFKEAECHVSASSIKCNTMVEKELHCGHKETVACHTDIESVKCSSMVEVTFKNCQHKGQVRCHEVSQFPKCTNPCSYRLECGHACRLKCHVDNDPGHLEYECRKQCGRLCDNGHPCSTGHVCNTSCPPCKKQVTKQLLCGHKKPVPCHVPVETVNCKEKCNKNLPLCGHPCPKPCTDPCGPCLELVEKTLPCGHKLQMECSKVPDRTYCKVPIKIPIQSACGHAVQVPCGVAPTVTPEDCVQYCNFPCDFWIPEKGDGGCGHKCLGSCSDCYQGRVHIQCQEPCGRTLPCGHQCDSPCSVACPPCKKPCNLVCDHNKCPGQCGQPCSPCVEPCLWRCAHKRCDLRCHEKCVREPCDLPCPKQLPCGHDCIGFCGEPCPRLCRYCNREELLEFMIWGHEEEEDSRFVLLEDCGHAIEHQSIDYYMKNDVQEGEIQAKCCPRCKTLIRKSKRYGNIIKERAEDICSVKKFQYGQIDKIRKLQKDLIARLEALRRQCTTIYLDFANHLWSYVVEEYFNRKQKAWNRKDKKVDINTLASLDVITKWLTEIVDKLPPPMSHDPLTFEHRTKYTQLVRQLFQMIMQRRLPLSLTERQDLEFELDRLHDVHQFLMMLSSPRYAPGAAEHIRTAILKIFEGCAKYNEKNKAHASRLMKEFDKLAKTGLGISDRERKDILQAFGNSVGRWFKCPNGHIYVITECGGAMQEGRCNECQAPIGGGNHALRSDNRLASEMDGARHSLYPGMA